MKCSVTYSLVFLLLLLASCHTKSTREDAPVPPPVAKKEKQTSIEVPPEVPVPQPKEDIFPIVYNIENGKELEEALISSFNKITNKLKIEDILSRMAPNTTSSFLGKEFLVGLDTQNELKFRCQYIYKLDKVVFYHVHDVLKIEIPRAVRPADEQSNSADCNSFALHRRLVLKGESYLLDRDSDQLLNTLNINLISFAKKVYVAYLDKHVSNENIELRLEMDKNTITLKDNALYSETLLTYDPTSATFENMFIAGVKKENYELYDYAGLIGFPWADVVLSDSHENYAGSLSLFLKHFDESGYHVIDLIDLLKHSKIE